MSHHIALPTEINGFSDALTMPAQSSTVLNTSDQNHQAMLTTEPLDTVNTVDVPTDLSTSFDYLMTLYTARIYGHIHG
jgi:hypothetical protein